MRTSDRVLCLSNSAYRKLLIYLLDMGAAKKKCSIKNTQGIPCEIKIIPHIKKVKIFDQKTLFYKEMDFEEFFEGFKKSAHESLS